MASDYDPNAGANNPAFRFISAMLWMDPHETANSFLFNIGSNSPTYRSWP